MASLEVLFEVPRWIETGLASGAFKRVGGVIVESTSKQVVAWLRDGGATEVVKTVTDAASSAPTPFGIIMNVARGAVTLLDGHMTRQAVGEVAAQVETVRQITSYAANVATFTAAGQVVNLAISAASFYAIMQRLDRLSDGIANLGELVRAEFNRDRDMRFRVALQTARDVFESTQAARDRAVTQRAVDGLYEARENFIFDLRQAINESKPLLAQQHFIRALYAETSRIRCYMAMDDPETARKRLLETMPVFHDEATKLIRLWFGPYPAAFFHKAVAPEVLDRFLQLQRWLQGDDPFTQKDDARVMFAIINDMRGDFWNPRVIENEYYDRVNQLLNRPQRTFQDRISNLTEALTSAEIIMENMQRLLGFELEIRSMRLMKQSFDDWSHLISEADLQQHGGGIIVDKEIIEHLRRQQATRRVQ